MLSLFSHKPKEEKSMIRIKDKINKILMIFRFFFCSATKWEQMNKEMAATKGGRKREKEDIVLDQERSLAHWLRKIVRKEITMPSKRETRT